MKKSYFNWSGGKDSALALYELQQQQPKKHTIERLLTTLSQTHQRVSMHGVRRDLLEQQIKHLDMGNIDLQIVEIPDNATLSIYNQIMHHTMTGLVQQGFKHAFFGDIFLQDLRQYRESQLQTLGITAHFPLWQRDTKALLHHFVDLGFKTMVVCVKAAALDHSFVGRVIDHDFIRDLPKNIDPCGENGEFHTFVFDGPLFKTPVPIELGEVVYREYTAPKTQDNQNDNCFLDQQDSQMGFWFCDLIPKATTT